MDKHEAMHALHRYFLWANRLRGEAAASVDDLDDIRDGTIRKKFLFAAPCGMYTALWLGLLYVLVEGYPALGSSEAGIDDLLKDADSLSILRRFRNGVFHFQHRYLDHRFDFATEPSQSFLGLSVCMMCLSGGSWHGSLRARRI